MFLIHVFTPYICLEHMQRICRASLEDLPTSRQRRQIIRLQGIRRMLEDLHRQIRQLQSSVQVEGGGGVEEGPLPLPLPPPTRTLGFTASRSRWDACAAFLQNY